MTFHESYVQSVWWALAKLHEKGLLYQGHKVLWWWAQGGTALSAGEAFGLNSGFPLRGDDDFDHSIHASPPTCTVSLMEPSASVCSVTV